MYCNAQYLSNIKKKELGYGTLRSSEWDRVAAEMCGDLRGKTGDPCCGSNMDSHPVASAGENKANLKGVGQVKHARTLTGKHTRTLTCLHTHTHTGAHTWLTHSFDKRCTSCSQHWQNDIFKGVKEGKKVCVCVCVCVCVVSTDHLETSGSTISISLPRIIVYCILIFKSYTKKSRLSSTSPRSSSPPSLLLVLLLLLQCILSPSQMQKHTGTNTE